MNLLSAQTIALQLFEEHGLEKWKFKFDRARTRFGCCNFTNQTISISRILTQLNSPEKVKDTILHEIAHALAGKNCAHGKAWRAKAVEIGCVAKRCYSKEEVETPRGKYTAKCGNCEKEFQAMRRRKGVACRECCRRLNGGKYSAEFRIEFAEN
ncbi:MAG: SprT-like domain-containing protein [Patescibacteria group bacterium]